MCCFCLLAPPQKCVNTGNSSHSVIPKTVKEENAPKAFYWDCFCPSLPKPFDMGSVMRALLSYPVHLCYFRASPCPCSSGTSHDQPPPCPGPCPCTLRKRMGRHTEKLKHTGMTRITKTRVPSPFRAKLDKYEGFANPFRI